MEALHDERNVRLIGISNVTAQQLRVLLDEARVLPAFVQNRCYAEQAWDAEVRAICAAAGVVYQGFSLLTANRALWNGKTVGRIASRLSATPAQVMFRHALHLGILPLTGSTSPTHLQEDLRSGDLRLTEEEHISLGGG